MDPGRPRRRVASPRDDPPVSRSGGIAGLVLAAGAGRRFGGPKQLAEIDGRPLVEHAVAALEAVAAVERVAVTLGAYADEVLARVDLHGATPIVVGDWAEGQSASLRAGVGMLAATAEAIVVTLADQPSITAATIARVIAEWDGSSTPVRATYEGQPGHPVLLTRATYGDVAQLRGDRGAREILAGAGVRDVPCDAGVVVDIDTPAQLDRFRDA